MLRFDNEERGKEMQVEEKINNDAETAIVKLLDRANDSVFMSTVLNTEFYDRPTVAAALKKAAGRVNEFYLLFDLDSDWKHNSERVPWLFELLKQGHIQIRTSGTPILHRMIVDGKHLRLEEKHAAAEVKVTNLVVWDAPRLITDSVCNRFLEWWNSAQPIPPIS